MNHIDLLTWLLAGVSAGALAGVMWSGTAWITRWLTLAAGTLGALVGGWIVYALFGVSAIAFLGSVCIGVLSAVYSCALLRSASRRVVP